MKTKILLFTVFGLFISSLISAQNIGNGEAPLIGNDSFNSPLKSGFYQTGSYQAGYPTISWPYPYRYLINLGIDSPGYQFQISTSHDTDDRVFFRTLHPSSSTVTWHEFATRGRNVFTGNQYINGTVYANLVKVETTRWSDFVFAEDYVLPTLEEVALHIKEHKHLPGIPSEKEAVKNGVDLLDISTKLLQKVEELTLYTIQQQQEIDILKSEIKELRK